MGWGVVEQIEGKLKSVAYGHISTSPKDAPADRLKEIARDLRNIIRTYAPDEATVEKLFFFKNQKTIIEVAQARGVILLTLAEKIPTLSEYTPLQIKQALTGYGRADKHQMQEMVKSILGLSTIPKAGRCSLRTCYCYLSHSFEKNFKNGCILKIGYR